jgi:hypothetical protein
MARIHGDWLTAFMDYASYGEAPTRMYFWSGVSAIAGALRRKVWIDQGYFRWHCNFYILLVAPPGIVSKTTTADTAMKLLARVPEIKFGPDIVTWPALVSAFAQAKIEYPYNGEYVPMSAMTLTSGELGNLLDPREERMVDLMVTLWDGKEGALNKETKGSGQDQVVNPFINLIGCTTPSWIAGNFPEYMIGGGLTSRMIFIYADAKRQFVAYPGLEVPKDFQAKADALVADLTHISELSGAYVLSPEAIAWGTAWYHRHYTTRPANMDMERFGGYIARKQTHMHKLAMILAASSSDELVIHREHLETAYQMITELEPDMEFVFSKIGKSSISTYAEKLVSYVHANGGCGYSDAYRYVHSHFPSMREFEDVLAGCVRAGYIIIKAKDGAPYLAAGAPMETATNGGPAELKLVA